jgi:mRNA-degrading endonuclease toxin of MazEF toxin-antitoxin module
MNKDFDAWNKLKKTIETDRTDHLPFNEREIWWCSLGVNLGSEENGKNELFERPVLVMKRFNMSTAIIIPLTTKHKENPYYHLIEHDGKTSSVILSQARLASVKRFHRIMTTISTYEFALVRNRLIDMLSYH